MDIKLLLRVLLRFKYLAIAAVILAVLAMTFSVARLDTSTFRLEYRQKLQFSSTSVLLVDGNRPSWLYALTPEQSEGTSGTDPDGSTSIADPARLGGLTSLYGFFVSSDAVRDMTGDDPVNSVVTETITADAGNGNREPLPLLAIIATAGSPKAAENLAGRATAAFQRFLVARQADAQVLPADRVTLRVVNAPSTGKLVASRSYTRAIVAGLMTLIAAIGLMLVIENLRPAAPPIQQTIEDDPPTPPPPTPEAKPKREHKAPAKSRRPSRERSGAAAATALAVKSSPGAQGSPHPEAPTA